jgi:AcrR family transcriptional regulator
MFRDLEGECKPRRVRRQVSRYGVYHQRVTRKYRLKRRAERRDDTRQRIVDAAIELHQTVGPAATTVSDIADRAGVGRVTVYRHFPDELTLFRACSGSYVQRNPLPDPQRWQEIADPLQRLRSALMEVYEYHRTHEAIFTHVLADLRDHEVMTPYQAHWGRAADVLVAPWRARGRRRALLRAGIGLALSFDAWRSLVRDHGLTKDQAVDVALRLAIDLPAAEVAEFGVPAVVAGSTQPS